VPTTFLSYSSWNLRRAEYLYDLLLQIDRTTVWVDWATCGQVDDWRERVAPAIRDADNFIALVTPEYEKSENCRFEHGHASNASKRTIAVSDSHTVAAFDHTVQWTEHLVGNLMRLLVPGGPQQK
jgi:hypothetical protein